jgi:hypothetical protein
VEWLHDVLDDRFGDGGYQTGDPSDLAFGRRLRGVLGRFLFG